MVVVLILIQKSVSSFEATFLMFSLNSIFICMNLRYALNKMEFFYYSISELPVIIFGFITISFTSYNLDIYDKHLIGLVGTSLITIFFIFLLSMRIKERINFYKDQRLHKKEMSMKRDLTNLNMNREPDNSDVADDLPVENIREPRKQRMPEEFEDTMKVNKPQATNRRKDSQSMEDDEEYKF